MMNVPELICDIPGVPAPVHLKVADDAETLIYLEREIAKAEEMCLHASLRVGFPVSADAYKMAVTLGAVWASPPPNDVDSMLKLLRIRGSIWAQVMACVRLARGESFEGDDAFRGLCRNLDEVIAAREEAIRSFFSLATDTPSSSEPVSDIST